MTRSQTVRRISAEDFINDRFNGFYTRDAMGEIREALDVHGYAKLHPKQRLTNDFESFEFIIPFDADKVDTALDAAVKLLSLYGGGSIELTRNGTDTVTFTLTYNAQ